MTEMAIDNQPVAYREVLGELRQAVLAELATRGLDDPERLAVALGVAPIKTRALLLRSSWSFDEAAWLVEKLCLPVTLAVHRNGKSS